MAYSRHVLQSIESPAFTQVRSSALPLLSPLLLAPLSLLDDATWQVRGSGDYRAGNDLWAPIGVTGLFAHALGVAVSKVSAHACNPLLISSAEISRASLRTPSGARRASRATDGASARSSTSRGWPQRSPRSARDPCAHRTPSARRIGQRATQPGTACSARCALGALRARRACIVPLSLSLSRCGPSLKLPVSIARPPES